MARIDSVPKYIRDKTKNATEIGSKQMITARCGYSKFNPIFFQFNFILTSL